MIITEKGNPDEEKRAVPTGKLFTGRQLVLGSIFGGPFVTGYILYKNFKTLDEHKKANAVIIIITFVTILAFFVFMRNIIPLTVVSYKNFMTLNEHKRADIVIIITFVTILAFFVYVYYIKPMMVLSFLYTGIAWGIMKKYLGNRIKEHINNGGELFGWKKLLKLIILGYVIMAAPILIILVLSSYF
ncbi:MAG: hypothetical protein LBG90_06025 [Spirochaetaceae bacterium]|jgi:hypothetical protein|nr:hypothetical protein [Spirochaetaceae bacterium]